MSLGRPGTVCFGNRTYKVLRSLIVVLRTQGGLNQRHIEQGAGVGGATVAAASASAESAEHRRLHLHSHRRTGGLERGVGTSAPSALRVGATPPPSEAQRGPGVRAQCGVDLGKRGASVRWGAAGARGRGR